MNAAIRKEFKIVISLLKAANIIEILRIDCIDYNT